MSAKKEFNGNTFRFLKPGGKQEPQVDGNFGYKNPNFKH